MSTERWHVEVSQGPEHPHGRLVVIDATGRVVADFGTPRDPLDQVNADRVARVPAMEAALREVADRAGDYADGAPDAHYLAKEMAFLETIARRALGED